MCLKFRHDQNNARYSYVNCMERFSLLMRICEIPEGSLFGKLHYALLFYFFRLHSSVANSMTLRNNSARMFNHIANINAQ